MALQDPKSSELMMGITAPSKESRDNI